MGEADVTDTLAAMRRCGRASGIAVSLNAFVAYCIAQAAAKHPEVLTYRQGRRIIRFQDVDLGTLMDRRVADGSEVPVGCMLRRAQEMSLAKLNWTFRMATRGEALPDTDAIKVRRLLSLPALLHPIAAWVLNRNPVLKTQTHGNIGLTSLNRQGIGWRYHALPPNVHTCTVALGGVYAQASPTGGEARRMLAVSVAIDHAMIDGIPMVHFTQTLGQMIEAGSGLNDAFVAETKALKSCKIE
ncbi:MAG: hypothetical protein ACFE0S_15325 [Rhodospirillales bacterium]